jgi:hypothetical protein
VRASLSRTVTSPRKPAASSSALDALLLPAGASLSMRALVLERRALLDTLAHLHVSVRVRVR